jgi:oligopeptide transport system permease protein
MGRYVIRRLLQMFFVILGTTFLIYAMVYALPGDPFAGRCGDRPCSEQYINAQRAKFNLNDPLPIQYGKYLSNLVRGDFGETFSGRPVIEDLKRTYPATAKLAFLAILMEIVVGISAGVMAGLRRGGFLDNLVLMSTLFVISIPVFVIGYVMQLTLGIKYKVFRPTVGAGAPWGDLILPAMVLGALSLAYVARLMRTSLAENLRGDYVRTAIAKGLPRRRVVGVHTLRNSLIPVVTFIGADFGVLLGGAIITEGIFNVRGVGGLTFLAIRTREGATVVGVVTVLVLVFLLVNLLVDLLYAVLDPRIRYE